MLFLRELTIIGVLASVASVPPAIAAIATFDSFSEGFSGKTIIDDGITFFDLDEFLPPDQVGLENFSIESTDSQLFGTLFSPPNYLTTEGFSPGSGFSFGRFGSMRMTTGEIADVASLNIFTLDGTSNPNSVLTLEAFLDGGLVASNSSLISIFEPAVPGGSVLAQKLSISNVSFDELRLIASASQPVFIGIDNVSITSTGISEPTSALSLLVIGTLGMGSALFRKQKQHK